MHVLPAQCGAVEKPSIPGFLNFGVNSEVRKTLPEGLVIKNI